MLPPWSRWFGADAMREVVPDERLRALIWTATNSPNALSAGDVTIDGDRRAVPRFLERSPPRQPAAPAA